MALLTIDFHVRGLAPVMFHNPRLADPTDELVRRLKVLTGKRKKTDADHTEIGRLEFLGGLYTDRPDGPNGRSRVVVEGTMIEGMLLSAAKTKRRGPACKSGTMSDGNWPLIYKGPQDAEKLYVKPFIDYRRVDVQGSAVFRTRPIFHEWELKFSVTIIPEQCDPDEVREWVAVAGRQCGLGDYRPKFGRFEVV